MTMMNPRQGSNTFISEIGSGPPVVLVHALGVSSSMWALQVPALAAMFRVIRYDVRGHGATPYVGNEELTIRALASDLEALLNELEVERAAIVGISMGGTIAQDFASRNPRRVSALGLISTTSCYGEGARLAFLERAALAEKEGMEPLIGPTVERWFTTGFQARAAEEGEEAEGRGEKGFEESMVASAARMLRATDPAAYAACCRALAAVDITGQLSRISAPTLVMRGEADRGITAESQDVLASNISQASAVVMPNSSHMIPMEQPDEFNSQLMSFLAWSAQG